MLKDLCLVGFEDQDEDVFDRLDDITLMVDQVDDTIARLWIPPRARRSEKARERDLDAQRRYRDDLLDEQRAIEHEVQEARRRRTERENKEGADETEQEVLRC